MKRLLLLALTAFPIIVNAATFFCSPNGSGDGNSYSTPCSFSNGLKKIGAPGDTLYLLGGQYDLGKTTVNLSGSSSRRIVISGYPGQKAILDFRTTAYGTRGLQVSGQYVHIKDLTLRYSGKNNLYSDATYCIFENLDIYGSADTGCQMKGGGYNLIKNCDSHDNFDYKLDKSGNLTRCDFGGNADGFADKQHNGAPNHYIGCRSWNNSDDGWDFYQRNTSSYSERTIIEDCICYQNGPTEYDMRNHPRYQTDRSWFDQFTTPIQVTDDDGLQATVSLEHYTNWGNANGFKLGGGYTVHNVLVHHCLAVANNGKGFDQNNDCGVMLIYNNTSYANYQNYGFWNCTSTDGSNTQSTLDIRNCLSLASRNANSLSTNNTTNNHNSWNSGFSCSAADFQSLDTTAILAPRQADGSYSPATLLRLKAGSALIDAGVVVGLSYYGSAPDLGCYEVTNGTLVTPDDTITNPEPEPEPVYECREGAHRIAFVTLPDSNEDALMLSMLRADSALCIDILSATDANTDYSPYEMMVLGPKPSSSASAYTRLKGLGKPMLVLKPWIFKSSVWNWGTAVNTQDKSILLETTATTDTTFSHLFDGLSIAGNQLQLFANCHTNAVTAISDWTNQQGMVRLASPAGNSAYTSMAFFPTGSSVGGTTFSEPLLMLGISEYSTTELTPAALTLIRNAVYFLLGEVPAAEPQPTALSTGAGTGRATKFFRDGQLFIRSNGHTYNSLGQLMQ